MSTPTSTLERSEPAGPGTPAPTGRRAGLTGRVLTAELRHGIAPWTFVVCLAVLLIAVLGNGYRAMEWTSMAQESRAVLIVLGPLVAGAACWQAGRERRRRTRELAESAPLSTLRRVTWALVPIWLAAAVAHLVTWGVLIALTAPNASAHGHPLVAPLLGDLAAIAAFAAGGHLIGWYLPSSWASTALTAAGTYGLMWGLHTRGHMLGKLAQGSIDFRGGKVPAMWTSLAHIAVFGGLAAVLLLIVAARRKWLVALPLAVVVVGATPLVVWSQNAWQPDRAGNALVCEGESPQICLRQAHESRRDDVEKTIRWAYGVFEGAPTVPARFEEHELLGLRTWEDLEPDVAKFGFVNPGDLGTDKRLDYFQRDDVLQGLLAWECERDAPSWSTEVLRWAHGQWPGDMEEQWRNSPVVKALDAMTPEQRKAWFTDYFAAARTCDPDRVERPQP